MEGRGSGADDPGAARPRRRATAALAALLILSLAIRVPLILGGGQGYWPDEGRYRKSLHIFELAAGGSWPLLADRVAAWVEHSGWLLAGAGLAGLHHAVLHLAGKRPTTELILATTWIPALLLAVAPVACLALVFALARRAGAGEWEALIAAGLLGASNVHFYYVRHLVPYDLSLAILLLALWVGIGPRERARLSLLAGWLTGLGLLTYYAHWILALVIGAVHVLYLRTTLRGQVRRALLFAIGFLAPILAINVLAIWRGEPPLLKSLQRFGRLAPSQSDVAEGWSLPWAYFWHAEHLLLFAWIAGVAVVLAAALRGGTPGRRRGLLWVGMLGGLYGILSFASSGLGLVGAFGRGIRCWAPFASLATACAAQSLASSPRVRSLALPAALAIALQAAVNFATPLAMRFPVDFARECEAQYGPLPRVLSVQGPILDPGQPRRGRYLLVNAQHLFPIEQVLEVPAGQVLRRSPHPLEFLPYQYEGLVPAERALLRSHDLSMRLLDTATTAQGPSRPAQLAAAAR